MLKTPVALFWVLTVAQTTHARKQRGNMSSGGHLLLESGCVSLNVPLHGCPLALRLFLLGSSHSRSPLCSLLQLLWGFQLLCLLENLQEEHKEVREGERQSFLLLSRAAPPPLPAAAEPSSCSRGQEACRAARSTPSCVPPPGLQPALLSGYDSKVFHYSYPVFLVIISLDWNLVFTDWSHIQLFDSAQLYWEILHTNVFTANESRQWVYPHFCSKTTIKYNCLTY